MAVLEAIGLTVITLPPKVSAGSVLSADVLSFTHDKAVAAIAIMYNALFIRMTLHL